MTYRLAIQWIIKKMDTVYSYANGLRDYADSDEKQFWNDLRRDISTCMVNMNRLDNGLPDSRAKMIVLDRDSSERKSGFYWVMRDNGFWYVASWSAAARCWEMVGEKEKYTDNDFRDIWPIRLQDPY